VSIIDAGQSLIGDFSKIHDPTKAGPGRIAGAAPDRAVIFGTSSLRDPWARNN
jgi:hypothetical protein